MTDTDTTDRTATDEAANAWHPTACILCECNCGIEIRLGADGRTFERTRGDKAHPASKGYTCEKALRLDYYQNGRGERLLSPLRRRADGTFEEIDWDTAIREVADRLAAVRDAHGGESIVYYGGGGQGNHLGGAYGSATLKALGVRFRANAISQEKTGEVLVMGKMFGTPLRGDFEHCEVAFFVGKNPWISHGIPHARTTLKAIAADPGRAMIVIDPRVTETAAMADFHLQVRSGRDAWLIAAMAAVLVDEGLVDRDWLGRHASGAESVLAALGEVPISRYCEISGVDETLVRAATRRIAAAASVAVFEDLGVQMNRHSTLVSYLEKLVWLLTGNLAIPGGQYAMSGLGNLLRMSRAELDPSTAPVSPVVGARLIGGLIPCNVIAEEILTDHPNRYRAMIVESGNPLHSVADSQRMREAMRALDVSVCIDVFMTETARQSDYVLPATTQYEKFEATFFNFDFPQERVPPPPAGARPARTVRCPSRRSTPDSSKPSASSTAKRSSSCARPRTRDRDEFAAAFAEAMTTDPKLGRGRAGGAVPHARTDAPARRGGRRRAVADGDPLLADATPTASPEPGSARDPTPATGCSTRSSTARRVSCSPTTPGRRRGDASRPTTASSTSRSPSSSTSWPSSPTRHRPATTPSGRCCCPPANGARSPRTRSCATRRGGRRTPTVRCASRPPMPSGSVSSTATPPR